MLIFIISAKVATLPTTTHWHKSINSAIYYLYTISIKICNPEKEVP